jgi:hypothetical protein
MKVTRLSLLCILVAGLSLAWSGTVELTLQDGLNGYDGCSDAYVSSSSSSNYGTATKLECKFDRCVS